MEPTRQPPKPPARGASRSMRSFRPGPGLLPFITVAVLILLALNLARLVAGILAAAPSPATVPPAASASLPKSPAGPLSAMPQPRQVNVPPLPHNLQFGNARALHTLTIFTDPACATCRAQISTWLSRADAGRLRLVYKYWPTNPADITGGLLLELARRHGLADGYWRSLSSQETDLSAADLFRLLEAQGLPLPPLREELTRISADLVATINQDISQGTTANLPPPPALVLDGYVLDNQPLQPERLATYIQRLSAGEPIAQRSDDWFAP